jgi:hypothetical protein
MGRHSSETLRKLEREARKAERRLAKQRARRQRADDRQPAATAPAPQGE